MYGCKERKEQEKGYEVLLVCKGKGERKITRRTAAYLCDIKKHDTEKHDNYRRKVQRKNQIRERVLAVPYIWRFAHNNALNRTGRSGCQKAAATPSSRLMRALCAVGTVIYSATKNLKNEEIEDI